LSNGKLPDGCLPLQVLGNAIEIEYNNRYGKKLCISHQMLNDVLIGAKSFKSHYRKDIDYSIACINRQLSIEKVKQ